MSYTRNDADTLALITEQHNIVLPDDVAAMVKGPLEYLRYCVVMKICAEHDIDVSEVVENFTCDDEMEDRIFAVRSHAISSAYCGVEWEKF